MSSVNLRDFQPINTWKIDVLNNNISPKTTLADAVALTKPSIIGIGKVFPTPQPLEAPRQSALSANNERNIEANELSPAEKEAVQREIQRYVKLNSSNMTESEVNSNIKTIMLSYTRSKKVYGPVARAWTEYLLEKANAEKMKLVFMARDGVVPYKIAKRLMAKLEYQKKYPNLVGEQKIVLGYFSRKVVASSQDSLVNENLFKEYAKNELGIYQGEHCLFVDVGFAGSMIDPIRKLLPWAKIDFDYLISATNKATGFVLPNKDFTPSGNRSVHWLEDTHQGNTKSPTKLVRGPYGRIYPDTAQPSQKQYTDPQCSMEFAVRKFSQKAVVRCHLDEPLIKDEMLAASNTFISTMEKIQKGVLPLFASHAPSSPRDDFDIFFSSAIFGMYVQKLQAGIRETLDEYSALKAVYPRGPFTHQIQKDAVDLISHILNFKDVSNNGNREFHRQVVNKLRDLINEKKLLMISGNDPGTIQSIEFIESMSQFVFSGTNMMPEFNRLMEQYIPGSGFKELNALPSSSIPQWIKKWHTQLSKRSDFTGIDNAKRIYDPRLLGDIPAVLFNYPLAGKNIKVIRTPNVVRDLTRNKENILTMCHVVEEFSGFLDNHQKHNRVHLYVNLMQRQNATSESVRTQCIEGLEKLYPETLQVITLAKNTDFYNQDKEFNVASISYIEFKKQFLSEMFIKSAAYRWPAVLNGDNWIKKCDEVLDKVHKNYFKDVANLSKQERQDFIEIAYTEIIETAMEQLKPDTCNVSCLSTVDRGAAVLTELFVKSCRKNKLELDAEQRKQLVSIALAPAILAQNRVMLQEWIDRFHTATERMLR